MKKVCIVAPGHSVERHPDGVFHSTGLYQAITFPKGGTFPFERTGVHEPLQGDEPNAYLGGSQKVVFAIVEACFWCMNNHITPEVVLSAGRPPYLARIASDVNMSEGSVMYEELRRPVGDNISIFIEDQGIVTKDDVLVILKNAASEEYEHVLVIMMTFRISRTEVLMQEVLLEQPEFMSAADKVGFLPAEGLDCVHSDEFIRMTLSDAYRRTMSNERFGIRQAVASGKAATTGGKT